MVGIPKGPASWTPGGLSPEEIESDLAKQATQEDQMAYLEAMDPTAVEAWAKWKEGKGEVSETPVDEAPAAIGDTGVRLTPKRMTYAAANQAVAEGNSAAVDPQQLAQMQSMQAAAAGANGQSLPEPKHVENAGILGGDAGWVARAAVNGLASAPIALPMNLFTQMLPYGGSVPDYLMDEAGVARPASRDARIMSDVISGISGSGGVGLTAKGLMKLGAKKAGEKLAAAPVTAAVAGGLGGGASGTVREEGGTASEQFIAGLLASMSPAALSAALKRGFRHGISQAQLDERMKAFEAAGTTPTVAQLTQGKGAERAEALLSQFYGSGGVMRNTLEGQEKAVINANLAKADEISPLLLTGNGAVPEKMSPAQMGAMLEETWLQQAKPALAAKRQELQQGIADEISPRAAVEVPKFTSVVNELAAINPDMPNLSRTKLVNPNLATFTELARSARKDIQKNFDKQVAAGVPPARAKEALPFEAVRELKTRIGSQIDDSVFGAKDIPQAEMRRLTGALTEDVKAFVESQGASAKQAFDEMNAWERAYHEQADYLKGVLDKSGGPEKVYNAAFAQTKAGPTIVKAVYDNMNEPTRKILTAGFIRQMGKSGKTDPEPFSLKNMFGNYSEMDEEAKEVIFGSISPQLKEDMDQLNRAAQLILESEKNLAKSANLGIQGPLYGIPSTVAYALSYNAQEGMGSAVLPVLMTMGATALGSAGLAKSMTNPKVVRWIASNDKIPPSAIPTAVNLLAQEARKSQDPDMIEFARLMEEATQDNGDD